MNKNKFLNLLAALLILILIINLLFSPISFYKLIQNCKIIYYKDNYTIKKVKVDSISIVHDTERGSTKTTEKIFYNNKNNNIRLKEPNSLINNKIDIKKYNHFKKTLLNKYLASGNPVIGYKLSNDSIWIWHNPKAKNLYSLGIDKQFNTKPYILKSISQLLSILIALISIIYLIKYHKNKL